MSTRIYLTVELEDGTSHNVTADMHDLRRWEQYAIKARLPHDPDTAPRITYMTYLAYSALQRQQVVSGTFDQFVALSIDANESEAVDPTRPAPGPDSSVS